MNKHFLWFLSFLITLSFALFQRMTGPTYPVKGAIKAGGAKISYRLPRSCTVSDADCIIKIKSPVPLKGYVSWKRYKTDDAPSRIDLTYAGTLLSGLLPDQPPAGKLEYRVFLKTAGGETELVKNPVVTRFKGAVPAWALIPHIIFIFAFMLYSVRIFISVFFPGLAVKPAVMHNILFLLLGGFLFGPLVQYYAFGAAWTGFPFGMDLTDNKTLLMLLAWLPALFFAVKGRDCKSWLVFAFAVTAAVYLIPHSMFGSELDYSKNQVVTGNR